MTHTLMDHEWDDGRIVAVGQHDVKGPWQEWERRCACGRVQRWREWPKEQLRAMTRIDPLNVTRSA